MHAAKKILFYRDVLDSYKRNSTLTVGNRIWVNSQFNILDKYKSRVLKMGTEVSNLDFGEEDVKEEINREHHQVIKNSNRLYTILTA